MQPTLLVLFLALLAPSLRADLLQDRMDAYIRRYVEAGIVQRCRAGHEIQSCRIRKRVWICRPRAGCSKYITDEVPDRVAIEADHRGSHVAIGTGREDQARR